ncbi:MAG: phenylalanine--tRNA ligase subunit alpha [Acidobacteria bacterium RIFCSPLOWO2_12_FULL_68_19]|nr:MAG: phenylalanine--tRNA ligase subunit alpha [Acidobacteria bacterium RIFCSPLOWO2_12_FULL_68_19]
MPDPAVGTAIETLRADFRARLAAAATDRDLKALDDAFLSRRSGSVTALLKQVASVPAEARREFGQLVNALKTEIESALDDKRTEVAATRPPAGAVDVSLASRQVPAGRVHPLMRVRQDVEDIFARMGYEILEGPEVEDDYHNFEALNMPPEHPARDMQDTLYLGVPIPGGIWGAHRSTGARGASSEIAGRGRVPEAQVRAATLLRTHTSAMQIRYMKTFPPPVRLIVPGRVYRRDNLDLSHTPMFQQFEGLVVGRGVTLADLKGTFEAMLRELFGDVKIRLRPSFFPYTEPSAEVDISCQGCGGAGCPTCKHTGWLEILGSGMVHPAVFEAVGYDADEVTGFAFGLGMERVAMLKYGVDDIRLFYENDIRFLEQFPL